MSALEVCVQCTRGGTRLEASWQMGNELTVLFGPSGAGKSTTLQSIAGLVRPDAGYVSISGRVMYDSSQGLWLMPWQRPVGYVFQDLALFPHMDVRGNILYGAGRMQEKERQEAFEGLLSRFKLSGLVGRKPSELSGGQMQRVAFARALMRQPEVLLLDEPFSALDRRLRREMQDFLGELREKYPIPVVLVTHDIDEAEALADKVVTYGAGCARVSDKYCLAESCL